MLAMYIDPCIFPVAQVVNLRALRQNTFDFFL